MANFEGLCGKWQRYCKQPNFHETALSLFVCIRAWKAWKTHQNDHHVLSFRSKVKKFNCARTIRQSNFYETAIPRFVHGGIKKACTTLFRNSANFEGLGWKLPEILGDNWILTKLIYLSSCVYEHRKLKRLIKLIILCCETTKFSRNCFISICAWQNAKIVQGSSRNLKIIKFCVEANFKQLSNSYVENCQRYCELTKFSETAFFWVCVWKNEKSLQDSISKFRRAIHLSTLQNGVSQIGFITKQQYLVVSSQTGVFQKD